MTTKQRFLYLSSCLKILPWTSNFSLGIYSRGDAVMKNPCYS